MTLEAVRFATFCTTALGGVMGLSGSPETGIIDRTYLLATASANLLGDNVGRDCIDFFGDSLLGLSCPSF